MKTLYVHIGTPKTGTSAIQSFCRKNRNVLDSKGYCYPIMPYVYPGIGRGRNGAFLQCTIYRDGVRRFDEEEHRFSEGMDIIRGYFETYDNVILSDEGLWASGYERKKSLWQDLKNYSDKYQFSVKIVVYLRRQDLFMDSRWRQRIKGSSIKRSKVDISWEEYIDDLPEEVQLDYYTALERISSVFGRENVIVRRFNRNYFPEGIVQADFLSIIGLELTDDYVIEESSVNESLFGNTCEMKRIVNSLAELTDKEYAFLRQVLLDINEYSGSNYPCSMFSAREAKEFMEQFRLGNQKVAEKYLNETGTDLFDMDVKDLPKWEKDNPYMVDDLIRFIAVSNAGMIRRMDAENKALRDEMDELRRKIRHPVKTAVMMLMKKFKAA